ncbi:MAG: LPS export ABC transporter periplasmic protein LptC [Bacteroidales bacterium]|nr:LPS export ABC transporter periplasmic protein LptC [Bacteroidales bacterium]
MKIRLSGRLTNNADQVKLHKFLHYFYSFSTWLLIFAFLWLISCKNDIETIQSLSFADTLPAESAKDMEVIYSDSGRIQALLKSPLMYKYEEEKTVMVFPDGFELTFYDSILNPKSIITARYGKVDENTKTMEARNNVVVVNYDKDEQLDTEKLIWDQRTKIIFSDVFVKITTEDKVIYGDGLTSDQDFSSYSINNPTGDITVNQEEL